MIKFNVDKSGRIAGHTKDQFANGFSHEDTPPKGELVDYVYIDGVFLYQPVIVPIRIITVGSMQTRFTVDEEVAISEGVDARAKVFRDRLLNAKYVDLDAEELKYGIAYLVNFLGSVGVLNAVNETLRADELLKDGELTEAGEK